MLNSSTVLNTVVCTFGRKMMQTPCAAFDPWPIALYAATHSFSGAQNEFTTNQCCRAFCGFHKEDV